MTVRSKQTVMTFRKVAGALFIKQGQRRQGLPVYLLRINFSFCVQKVLTNVVIHDIFFLKKCI